MKRQLNGPENFLGPRFRSRDRPTCVVAGLSHQEIIAVLSADGTLQFANSTFQASLDYRPDELVGPQPLRAGALRRRRLRSHASETGRRAEWRAVSPAGAVSRSRDGSWRWFEISCRSRLADPAIEGILLHGLDVTDLHRMESERQVISDVVHALNQTANLDQLLNRIHLALKRILTAENCFVALHDPQRDVFEFPFFADEYDVAPPRKKSIAAALLTSFAPERPTSSRNRISTAWRRLAKLSSWALLRPLGSACR